MVGDLLRHFQLAAVLQIRRDAGRAEGMIGCIRIAMQVDRGGRPTKRHCGRGMEGGAYSD